MPSRLSTPVLTVDPAKIHQVDTRNPESLHGMWMGECLVLPALNIRETVLMAEL